ncbi:MAG: hypothetical protein ACOYMS_02025 [Terrimicrobiaceae bacterium]
MRMNRCRALLLASVLLPASTYALDWEIEMPFEDTIFPSIVVGMRGFMKEEDMKETEIGDPIGMIGASITAPEDDFEVKVTVEETDFFKKSTIKATLPKKGKTYSVMPLLRYDVSNLLKHKQKGFDTAHVTVETADGEYEDTKRFEVRSINDCVLGLTHNDEFINTRFLFAAYVNENNPALDKILGYALKQGYVDSFIGYQGTRGDVVKQATAIYKALQDMGFKYSSITGASGESETIFTQHIRFVGESLDTSQANCIDGTVMMASLFMKIGLNPVIICVPGHAYVGVYKSTAAELEFLVPIETTVVGNSSFDHAVKLGKESMAEHAEDFADSENMSCLIINVRDARDMGIDPIQEADVP